MWQSTAIFVLFFYLIIADAASVKSLKNLLGDVKNCVDKKCIRKCCPRDEFVDSNTQKCRQLNRTYDFVNISVYKDDLEQRAKTLLETFQLVSEFGMFDEVLKEDKYMNSTFKDHAVASDYGVSTRLSESGILYLEVSNSYTRWNPVDYFCVDYLVTNFTPTAKVWYVVVDPAWEQERNFIYFNTATAVSSLLLFMVFLVYILLPELRNLVGLVLMAYLISLIGSYIFLIASQIGSYRSAHCPVLSAITYFFLFATFCWMNVLSYEIWWTFKNFPLIRVVHRRGDTYKFGLYSIYGWGLPLAMAVGLMVMNELDLSHISWILEPRVCRRGWFLEDKQLLVYFYVPMLILIACNCFYFFWTVFILLKVSRKTAIANLDAAGSPLRNQWRRLMILYVKLSIVMGISWVIEIVTYMTKQFEVWMYYIAYNNLLSGVAIFLIYVCKKDIYVKLRDRYFIKCCRRS